MNSRLLILFFCFLLSCCQTRKQNKVHAFDKITFHTTGCLGFCPVFHLEIYSSKTFELEIEDLFIMEHYMKSWDGKDSFLQMRAIRDTNARGFYKGLLPDSTFYKLNNEILNVGLDTLSIKKKSGGEGPTYSISIYYNSKKKQLISEEFPEKLNKLLGLLFSICDSKNLKKNNGRLYIEE